MVGRLAALAAVTIGVAAASADAETVTPAGHAFAYNGTVNVGLGTNVRDCAVMNGRGTVPAAPGNSSSGGFLLSIPLPGLSTPWFCSSGPRVLHENADWDIQLHAGTPGGAVPLGVLHIPPGGIGIGDQNSGCEIYNETDIFFLGLWENGATGSPVTPSVAAVSAQTTERRGLWNDYAGRVCARRLTYGTMTVGVFGDLTFRDTTNPAAIIRLG
jgi:hypothetical protein